MTAVMSLERGVSLHEAREMVQTDDSGKWDITVSRDSLSVCDGLLTFGCEIGEQQLSATTWATSQLCTRLGIPTPYFRKCPPELQDSQANYWLRNGEHKPGEKWLLRARDNNLRAVLSERYSPLDNAVLLDELRLLLPDSYRVDWFGLADESLHLRVVDPERYREVLPNDALTVGIHLGGGGIAQRGLLCGRRGVGIGFHPIYPRRRIFHARACVPAAGGEGHAGNFQAAAGFPTALLHAFD